MIRIFSLITLFAIPVAADAQVSWSGSYSGNCGSGVQCETVITDKHSGKFDVAFVVADHLNDKDIKCHLSGAFVSKGKALQGNVGTDKVVVSAAPGGSIHIKGLGSRCGFKFDGEYVYYGDY